MNNKQVSIMINADVYAVLKKQAALDERSVRSWFERYIKATFEDDYSLITGIAVKETISHATSDVDDILKKFNRHEQVTEQVTEQVDNDDWMKPTPPDPRIVAEIEAAEQLEQAQYDEDADYFGLR